MRQAIDNYTLDKEAAPQSLEDLTSAQAPYLREVPVDPMTQQKDWHTGIWGHGDESGSIDQWDCGRAFELQRDWFERHTVQHLVVSS